MTELHSHVILIAKFAKGVIYTMSVLQKRLPSATLIVAVILAATTLTNSAAADPTVLTKVITAQPVLVGLEPMGMGGAYLATRSPALLHHAPPSYSVDLAVTSYSGGVGDDGLFRLEAVGLVIPLGERKGTMAIRGLAFSTNTFGQGEYHFTPIDVTEVDAYARENDLLVAWGKVLRPGESIGVAFPVSGKSQFHVSGTTGGGESKAQSYYLRDKPSLGLFYHRFLPNGWAAGGNVFLLRSEQQYSGSDFNGRANSKHDEYRVGFAYSPDPRITYALDVEHHRTYAPLHGILPAHEGETLPVKFDSTVFYAGLEYRPRPSTALRAGVFQNASPTLGASWRAVKLFGHHYDVHFAYTRNLGKHEFDEFEPGLFGESSDSFSLTLAAAR